MDIEQTLTELDEAIADINEKTKDYKNPNREDFFSKIKFSYINFYVNKLKTLYNQTILMSKLRKSSSYKILLSRVSKRR